MTISAAKLAKRTAPVAQKATKLARHDAIHSIVELCVERQELEAAAELV